MATDALEGMMDMGEMEQKKEKGPTVQRCQRKGTKRAADRLHDEQNTLIEIEKEKLAVMKDILSVS